MMKYVHEHSNFKKSSNSFSIIEILFNLRSLTSSADSSCDTHVLSASHEHYDKQRHSCYTSPTTHNTLLKYILTIPPPFPSVNIYLICN